VVKSFLPQAAKPQRKEQESSIKYQEFSLPAGIFGVNQESRIKPAHCYCWRVTMTVISIHAAKLRRHTQPPLLLVFTEVSILYSYTSTLLHSVFLFSLLPFPSAFSPFTTKEAELFFSTEAGAALKKPLTQSRKEKNRNPVSRNQ